MKYVTIDPDEEQSDAYKIFNLPWLVSIPEIYMRSAAVVAEEGTLTTGDKELDLEVQRSARFQYKTIAAMLIYFDEGASITICNNKDIFEIYKIVSNHLKNWEWIVTYSPFSTYPPLEDLFLMESFLDQLGVLKDNKEKTLKHELVSNNTLFGAHGSLLKASMLARKLKVEDSTNTKVNVAAVNSIAERIARIVMRGLNQ